MSRWRVGPAYDAYQAFERFARTRRWSQAESAPRSNPAGHPAVARACSRDR